MQDVDDEIGQFVDEGGQHKASSRRREHVSDHTRSGGENVRENISIPRLAMMPGRQETIRDD